MSNTVGPDTPVSSQASLPIMDIASTLPLMVGATFWPLLFQNPIILTEPWEPSSWVIPHKVNPGLQRRTNIELLKDVGPLSGIPYYQREGRTTLFQEHRQEVHLWPQTVNLFQTSTSLNLLIPSSVCCQHSSGTYTSFTPDQGFSTSAILTFWAR